MNTERERYVSCRRKGDTGSKEDSNNLQDTAGFPGGIGGLYFHIRYACSLYIWLASWYLSSEMVFSGHGFSRDDWLLIPRRLACKAGGFPLFLSFVMVPGSVIHNTLIRDESCRRPQDRVNCPGEWNLLCTRGHHALLQRRVHMPAGKTRGLSSPRRVRQACSSTWPPRPFDVTLPSHILEM